MGKQFKYFLLRLRSEAESGEWESRRGKAGGRCPAAGGRGSVEVR
ncbi:MAG: hypothetical protein Q8S26_17980 [Azonexus sp.]|nr:hypothetical protein [Azonexus sp.]